ncbi:YaaL family protein [Carnobacterium inhibens]|uniref:YaaL family protein n=1 Tax=Carnobacterium inhibens TaxID=147709 RepID=UPI0020413375|nr:YaaL family protein [Carnobacterium inhibens]MCM3513252.1 YaaL family protein [Carnobacterium inhibens]
MLFKKKQVLRKEYDTALLKLMTETKSKWEYAKRIEHSVIEKDSLLFAQTKLAEAKYFYLFKEAKKRHIKGDTSTLESFK